MTPQPVKEQIKQHSMEYTYQKGRKCRHCHSPIPHQAHGATEFCERKALPDSTIQSCRNAWHNARRSEVDRPYLELMAFQKKMTHTIAALKQVKGEVVTVDDLNRYDIVLARPVELRLVNGEPLFCFIHHQIYQQPGGHFKIIEHAYTP